MHHSIAVFLTLIPAYATAMPPQASDPPRAATCDFDPKTLDGGYRDFDADRPGGWRALERQEGCADQAAEALRRYRQRYEQLVPLLAWHEGQVRASMGAYPAAIVLMRQSRSPEGRDQTGWNPYVDATIAFLEKDRTRFAAAQRRLLAMPRPAGWPAKAAWPQNAKVLDGLSRCFGESYKVAYSDRCRQ